MKQILIFLILLVINTVTPQFLDVNSCEEGDGVIGCSDDCSSRQFCMNGKIKDVKCPKTALFLPTYCNSANNKCELKKQCENENTLVCPGRGIYPHLFSCNKLYMCGGKGQQGVLKKCPRLKKYDAGTESCTGFTCYSFSPIFGKCMGKNNQIVAHPQNEKLYVHCSSNGPTLGSCADGYAFNQDTFMCEFKCPKSGLFINSLKKQCYFKCTWQIFKYKHEEHCCEGDEVFNDSLKMCGPDVTRNLSTE